MSDQFQIDIRPPYLDDAWALCHTSLNGEWFHVGSHGEAVETLQDRLTEFAETGSSPDEEQIAIDCHPDYSSALTTSELLGSGLSQFGITSGGQFDSSHWYEHQTEYEEWVLELAAQDAEENRSILHVALSEPDRESSGSNPWEWTRVVWIQPQASGSGYNVVLHDASNYAWAIQDNWQTSGVVRILQGDWPMTHTEEVPAPTAVPRYQLNVRRADEYAPPSHLEWPGIDSAETVTLLSDPDGTPFDSDFEYCRNVPSAVNGWEYAPTRLTGHERWEQSDGHAYVKILHHHTDFSWVEVGDDRLGGVRGRFPGDSLPGKVQAEYSDAEARSVAIDWMKTHDPELWSHPGHHECLHQPPEGWTLAKGPRVVQGSVTVTCSSIYK